MVNVKDFIPIYPTGSCVAVEDKNSKVCVSTFDSVRQVTGVTAKILGTRLQAFFWDCLLKGPTGCLETSLNSFKFPMRNIPEERRSNI